MPTEYKKVGEGCPLKGYNSFSLRSFILICGSAMLLDRIVAMLTKLGQRGYAAVDDQA